MDAVRKMAHLSIATSIATIALKFGAWYLTGSVSLWSDALESLVNLAAALVALGAIALSQQPADERHRYGHEKVEYFSSGVEGTLIVVAAVAIIASGVNRLIAPQPLERLGPGVLISLLAGAANLVAARLMLKVAREHDSITLEADAKHLLTDVFTTAGILCGLVVVMIVPQWSMLDPLMAIAVGLHIIFIGAGLVSRSVDGLMDTALPLAELERFESLIRRELPPKASFHALRTRKAGARRFVELHLLVPGSTTVAASHALCDRIEAALALRLPKSEVTIHVEPAETQPPHG